jgi:hypothetical protein
MEFNYGTKRTAAEAAKEVDAYVEPRECFIWHINSKWGFQSFSATGDTPCAHYVAHQLELKATNGVRCHLGYPVRVSDLVSRLGDPISIDEVKAGDVWARLKGANRGGGGNEPTSHCGMVRGVVRTEDGKPPVITIRHCSSGQRKVADDDWAKRFGSGGQFYRLPSRDASAAAHANLQRLVKGFAYKPVLGGTVRS